MSERTIACEAPCISMTTDSAAVRATKGQRMKLWIEVTHFAGFDWARAHHDVVIVGLVAKRTTDPYPVQLRSPEEEFVGWVKHRWAY